MSESSTGPHGFTLTPIEQNCNGSYRRVALILPLRLPGQDCLEESRAVYSGAREGFFYALGTWPFLTWRVGLDKGGNAGKLKMLNERCSAEDVEPPFEYLGPGAFSSRKARIDEALRQLRANSLGSDFFPMRTMWDSKSGMSPVRMKVTCLGNLLVLGFSFFESVVDTEFMRRFFFCLLESTRNTHPFQSNGTGRTVYTLRTPLEAILPTQTRDFDLFHWYAWGTRNPCTQPKIKPPNRLLCRLIEFKRSTVVDLISCVRRAVVGSVFRFDGDDAGYVVAILWASIMMARHDRHRTRTWTQTRLSCLFAGEPLARNLYEYDGHYFGNSRVPVVAELAVSRLVSLDENHNDYYCRGSGHSLKCLYNIKGLAEAASAIRLAIAKVSREYVQRLMGFKAGITPVADQKAYETGLLRSTTGVEFVDWSGLVRGDQDTGIPFAKGRNLRILPCVDDKEEGRIVLLPRLPGPGRAADETGWTAWVCLDGSDMISVVQYLKGQDLIVGE